MPKTILVIDDEPQILQLLRIRLQANNYKVICANDGDTVINIVRAENPDLIITDITLPGISGLSICRMLKGSLLFKHIPIIILSGKGCDIDIETGLAAGADAYIVKPFEATELLNKIAELLK